MVGPPAPRCCHCAGGPSSRLGQATLAHIRRSTGLVTCLAGRRPRADTRRNTAPSGSVCLRGHVVPPALPPMERRLHRLVLLGRGSRHRAGEHPGGHRAGSTTLSLPPRLRVRETADSSFDIVGKIDSRSSGEHPPRRCRKSPRTGKQVATPVHRRVCVERVPATLVTSPTWRHTHDVEVGGHMAPSTSNARTVARRSILRVGAVGSAGLAFGAVQGVVRPSLGRTRSALAGRRVRRHRRRAGRPAVPRAVPDQSVDPLAVHRPTCRSRGRWHRSPRVSTPPGRTRRVPAVASRARWATSSTRSGRARSGLRTRSCTRSTPSPARTRSPPRRCCRSTRRASRRCRSRGPDASTVITHRAGEKRTLPPSTIYGFNGTFPGPMINAEYGKPALVRFENHLDENPLGTGPAGLRCAGPVLPDSSAQRSHRA